MKQYLIRLKDLIILRHAQEPFARLKEAIRKGILRIFPLPITVGELSRTIAFVVACTLIGCATPKQVTQLVRDTRVDTLYLSNTQYDSIYIYKDRVTDRSKDTVYLKDISIEYRYKMLRDTVRIVQRDSIPYQVTVVETKEITRPLTIFDRLCRICFFFLLGSLLTWIVIRLRTVFKP